jgi:serine/threonine protein kinase
MEFISIVLCFLSSGSYRDAWRFRREHAVMDHFVIKRMILKKKHNWDEKDVYKINKEANILERLSHSPRVLDIYGACGTTVLIEAMAGDLHKKIILGDGYANQTELDALDEVQSFNHFTASEKLQISLDMAESLADLHGFEGGPIIHADTHIEQWLIAPDGSIQLNDFNNAHEPLWNEKKRKYCTTHSTYGGVVSSVEH